TACSEVSDSAATAPEPGSEAVVSRTHEQGAADAANARRAVRNSITASHAPQSKGPGAANARRRGPWTAAQRACHSRRREHGSWAGFLTEGFFASAVTLAARRGFGSERIRLPGLCRWRSDAPHPSQWRDRAGLSPASLFPRVVRGTQKMSRRNMPRGGD